MSQPNMIGFYSIPVLPETYFLPAAQFQNYASTINYGANSLMGPAMGYTATFSGDMGFAGSASTGLSQFTVMPAMQQSKFMEAMLMQMMQMLYAMQYANARSPYTLPPDAKGKPTPWPTVPPQPIQDNPLAPIETDGTSGDDTQIDLGTPGQDIITQTGLAGNDTQYISGADDNDRLKQYGGKGNDNQSVNAGYGDDYVYQDGGAGDNTQTVDAGDGNDWVSQATGAGADNLTAEGGFGNDYIKQDSGAGKDTLNVNAGDGDDSVDLNAGAGDDTLNYIVSNGNDQVLLDGGKGTDAFTITGGTMNFTVMNAKGEVIFQQGTGGSVIKVANAENLKILGADGNVVYQS